MFTKMNNRICILFTIIILLLTSTAGLEGQHQEGIEGIWLGTLKVGEMELRIALTFLKSEDNIYSATMNSIDQSSGEIPMEQVVMNKDSLLVKHTGIGIVFEGLVDLTKNTFDSEFRQGPGKFPLLFHKVDKLPISARPQEPKKPYPYKEEQVEYEHKAAGIKIAGTLTYPASGGPFPAVILLSGSGPQNRDEEIFGHKPFMVLADYLTRHGIAVLRSDERGVGGTTGSFKGSTTEDFAKDALAGVAYLISRDEINPEWIGLAGHSEGGMMAPIAASKSSDIAFIVMMAGPGIAFSDVILFQKELRWKNIGMSDEDMELNRSWHNQVSEIAAMDIDNEEVREKVMQLYEDLNEEEKTRLRKTPESMEGEIEHLTESWWRFATKYNARATLMKVKCPVLAINGSKDMQVVARENLPAIEEALQAGGSSNFLIKELEGLNHLFQTADTGDESEYGKIEETFSPVAMKLIADWILQQVEME
jgi:fermentation-respiration switch protein FrsA (DUF1100 family)